jgi:NADH-quinone oxidoreductase subunit N
MNFVVPDLYPAASEIFVALAVLVIMLVTVFARRAARGLAYFLTQLTLLITALITIGTLDGNTHFTFSDMFVSDPLSGLLKLVVCFAVMIALLYGRGYLADRKLDRPEYYLLVLLMTLGMMVMITANHMLVLYIGLEMMSLSLYALIAFDRDSVRSTEAGMKYFVLGALASGLLLYGMSMIYGATGSLDLTSIAKISAPFAIDAQSTDRTVLLFGIVFIVAGIAFKFGVVPFHMWVPDVYQGAPTAVTLLIATAPKLAAFAMAIRLLVWGLPDLAFHWQGMLMFVAAASIILGNLAAIVQHDLKRMLAYSGISHMGFVLLGLLSGFAHDGVVFSEPSYSHHWYSLAFSGALFYAISYVLMSLAAFGMIVLLSRAGFEAQRIDDFKGLNRRSPWFAAMMMFVMFSMAGIPFFVGFFAKFTVLQAVLEAGHLWLAVLAIVMSVIGAFYYLRIVKLMYFDEPEDATPLRAPAELRVMLSANGLAVAVLGIAPQALLTLCEQAFLASSLYR